MSWTVLTGFLGGSMALAVTFAATAGYARKETAVGFLAPEAGAVRVMVPRPGRVETLYVADGDVVRAGDPLFGVDLRTALSGTETLDGVLLAGLERQTALLAEQIRAEEERASGEVVRMRARLEGLAAERAELSVQRDLQAERAAVTGERLKALGDLRGKGYVSEAEYRAREEAWLAQRQSLAAHDQRLAQMDHELAQAKAQAGQLPSETADRLARLRAALEEIEGRRAEVSAQRGQVVRAPVAGRVTALQASPGMAVDGLRPVLTLVPEDGELRAELFVPSRAIGFVEPGQTVRLLYDAFPFQRFGAYAGTVERVAETVVAPNEALGPIQPKEPSYRVSVRLERQTVDAFGRQVPLQPDMTVQADIVLEDRTLMEWLLEPLMSAKGRM